MREPIQKSFSLMIYIFESVMDVMSAGKARNAVKGMI